MKMHLPPSSSQKKNQEGFSLVEVTLALGIIGYALLALLGLFSVGLDSSRNSVLETSVAQIGRHIADTYDAAANPGNVITYERTYDYGGGPLPSATSPGAYFKVLVEGAPSVDVISNGTQNLHLLTVKIEALTGQKFVMQTSAIIQ